MSSSMLSFLLFGVVFTLVLSQIKSEGFPNGIGRAFEDPIKDGLKDAAYYGCKVKHTDAPEKQTKQEKILYYSDSIKSELWFIDKEGKRSSDYDNAMWDLATFTTMGKNKTDDAADSLAQAMRVFESQSNGAIDIILNPFR